MRVVRDRDAGGRARRTCCRTSVQRGETVALPAVWHGCSRCGSASGPMPSLIRAATLSLAVRLGRSPRTRRLLSASPPRTRDVYLDRAGRRPLADNRREVSLFGANYVLPTASDYRAAGYLHADRKRMIEEDMAHFARMGWDGLRLTFWGDWEASDSAGNLIANDHLDLLDWLDRPRARAGHLPAVQPDPALRLQLAGRARTTRPRRASDGASAAIGWAPTRAAIAAQVELPAPDPAAREPVHRRRAQGRAGHPLRRAGERAGAPPRGSRRARSATSTPSPTRCAAPAAASWCSTT